MARKGPRQIVFACSSIIKGQLTSEILPGDTVAKAQLAFQNKFGEKPQIVLGPFYRKRSVLESQTNIKFTGASFVGIFNEWYVKAMVLSSPENSVFLIYDRRVDDKKQPKPQICIVQVNEVRKMTSEEEISYKNVSA